jgi:hypothetical protein
MNRHCVILAKAALVIFGCLVVASHFLDYYWAKQYGAESIIGSFNRSKKFARFPTSWSVTMR